MYGYVINEIEELMLLLIVLFRKLVIKFDEFNNEYFYLFGRDGKC